MPDNRVHAQDPGRPSWTVCGLAFSTLPDVILGTRLEAGVLATFGDKAFACRDCWRATAGGDWMRTIMINDNNNKPVWVHRRLDDAGTTPNMTFQVVCGLDLGTVEDSAKHRSVSAPEGAYRELDGVEDQRPCPRCWGLTVDAVKNATDNLSADLRQHRARIEEVNSTLTRLERQLTQTLGVTIAYLQRYARDGGDIAQVYERLHAIAENRDPAAVKWRDWKPVAGGAIKPPFDFLHSGKTVQGELTADAVALCGWRAGPGHVLISDSTMPIPLRTEEEACPRCWFLEMRAPVPHWTRWLRP